jgi:hypothetical protein
LASSLLLSRTVLPKITLVSFGTVFGFWVKPGEENHHEGHATQRRADHRDPEARRGRIDDGGVMPTARITEQTYYRWKAKYGGMDSSEAKKLKHWRMRTGS